MCAEGGTTRPYRSQLLQHLFIDAALFEVYSRALNDICDDLLVHVSDLCVRHLGVLSRGDDRVLLWSLGLLPARPRKGMRREVSGRPRNTVSLRQEITNAPTCR